MPFRPPARVAARRRVTFALVTTPPDQGYDVPGAPHISDRRPFDKSILLQHVLVTRPHPGAAETATRLKARGMVPVVAPVLTIVRRALLPPVNVAATLLSSRNAIAACGPALFGRPAFTVGDATAAAARAAGFRHVASADGDGLALATLVAASLSPDAGTLFLPVAQRQGQALAAALRARGYRVVRRVAYQAVGVPALPPEAEMALRGGQATAALFFSGETSRHFVRLVKAAGLADALRAVEAVSISPRAAVALKELPWRRIHVASKPNQEAMLALLP